MPTIAEELKRRGVTNPSLYDILNIVEENADVILTDKNLAAALRAKFGDGALDSLHALLIPAVSAFVVWAKRRSFSFRYEDAVILAKSYGLERLLKFMIAYPNTSRRVLEFLKRVSEEMKHETQGT